MRIYYNQLSNSLTTSPEQVWLVFGDEPWQKNDSLSKIKLHAQQAGFIETIHFSVDEKFSWQDLINEYQAMSLFANQRIIDVEMNSGKISEAGNQALTELAEHLHQDVLLLIHGPKLEAATTNKKWFKSLSNQGKYLPLYDMDVKGLTMWLSRQTKFYQLNLSPQASQLLVELFEGNILALDQELQKLAILFNHQAIDVDDLAPLVINQAKFNPFLLIDTLLLGDLSKCLTILDQLAQEGTPVAKVIWFLHKELNTLQAMVMEKSLGTSFNELCKKHRIWDKRKPLYQYVVNHTSVQHLDHAIARLIDCDLISKTSSDFDPYLLLADVCVSVYQSEKTQMFSLDYEF